MSCKIQDLASTFLEAALSQLHPPMNTAPARVPIVPRQPALWRSLSDGKNSTAGVHHGTPTFQTCPLRIGIMILLLGMQIRIRKVPKQSKQRDHFFITVDNRTSKKTRWVASKASQTLVLECQQLGAAPEFGHLEVG